MLTTIAVVLLLAFWTLFIAAVSFVAGKKFAATKAATGDVSEMLETAGSLFDEFQEGGPR